MKVAIVHDLLVGMGGAEYVAKVFREIFPDAPIYTGVYNPSAVCPSFRTADVRTSFIQRMPFTKKHSRSYLPLYPYAFELFDLSEFDVVLSSSFCFAKGAITPPDTCHICYCYTPMRFAWNYHAYIEQEPFSRLTKLCLPYVVHRLRRWDEITANRVDHYIAISSEVQKRIRKYYRRGSDIIHPPVDASRFAVSDRDEGYYLILSRLVAYKRVDIVVEAFNRLRLPLKVIGTGRDLDRLQKMAGPNVEFLGRLPDEDVQACLQRCRALIFPGLEDFGIVPVEAMSCGKPVIAYAGGGALETIRDGITGCFFYEQTPDAVAGAVGDFDPDRFDPKEIRAHAELFDVSVFKEEIQRFVTEKHELHKSLPLLTAGERFGILGRTDGEIVGSERRNVSEAVDGR